MPSDNEMSERLRSALNGAALSHDGKPTGLVAVSISLLNDAADALDKAQRERDELKKMMGTIATDIHAYADTEMMPVERGRCLATRESKAVRRFATRLEDAIHPVPNSDRASQSTSGVKE